LLLQEGKANDRVWKVSREVPLPPPKRCNEEEGGKVVFFLAGKLESRAEGWETGRSLTQRSDRKKEKGLIMETRVGDKKTGPKPAKGDSFIIKGGRFVDHIEKVDKRNCLPLTLCPKRGPLQVCRRRKHQGDDILFC